MVCGAANSDPTAGWRARLRVSARKPWEGDNGRTDCGISRIGSQIEFAVKGSARNHDMFIVCKSTVNCNGSGPICLGGLIFWRHQIGITELIALPTGPAILLNVGF